MKLEKRIYFIVFALFISFVSLYPYIFNELNMGHDTFFHLSRIEGYAQAINNNDFFPSIYPFKNNNYGYISPTFYCDVLLLLPAILYNLGIPIVISYKIFLFILAIITVYTTYKLVSKFTNNSLQIMLGITLYIFSLYRLSNIFVRSALGEIMALAFLPLLLLGIYEVINEYKYKKLIVGFSLVLLSHNISFILCCIMFLFFLIINIKKILNDKLIILNIFKAVFIVMIITSFYWVGLVEGLINEDIILNTTSYSNLLKTSSLHMYQYFTNSINNNVSLQEPGSMTVTVGIFLILLPFMYIFYKKRHDNEFIFQCSILGYIFLILQSSMIDWSNFGLLSFLQFTWRFMIITSVLLVLPATIYSTDIFNKYKSYVASILIVIVTINGGMLLLDPLNRDDTLSDDVKYDDLINGTVIDPYYSAYFMRVELAGGDYLPIDTIDFRDVNNTVTDINDKHLTDYKSNYNEISFVLNQKNMDVILPKSYYSGYKIYNVQNTNLVELDIYKGNGARVAFNTKDTTGDYILMYEQSFIKKISIIVSIFGIIILMMYQLYILKKKE